jgi:hypothetical protein
MIILTTIKKARTAIRIIRVILIISDCFPKIYYRDCCFDQVVNALCNVHTYIGVGSVFSLLKTLGWAIELYAGNGMACEVVDEEECHTNTS